MGDPTNQPPIAPHVGRWGHRMSRVSWLCLVTLMAYAASVNQGWKAVLNVLLAVLFTVLFVVGEMADER